MKKNKVTMVVLSSVLATTMLMTNTGVKAESKQSPPKEEVIYALTTANGYVDRVYAVNILEGTKVTDYGRYSDLKLLSQSGRLENQFDRITITSNGGKSYYQGLLRTKELPWKIELHYYINDVEYPPKDLAKKSGKLRITFKISQNKACEESFYQNYALQSSVTLDGKLCKDSCKGCHHIEC